MEDAMNPIPSVPIPTWPMTTNGYLDVVLLVSIASIMVVFAMLLWRAWPTVRERLSLICPVRLRRARVHFSLAPTGERMDVLRCSIFGRRPISCGKVCMHASPRI